MSEPLILALPSKGRLKEQAEAWLADCGFPVQAASWASLFRITPSAMILRLLASSVAPVEVMSTISSAAPAAGAPSVAPPDSTMR